MLRSRNILLCRASKTLNNAAQKGGIEFRSIYNNVYGSDVRGRMTAIAQVHNFTNPYWVNESQAKDIFDVEIKDRNPSVEIAYPDHPSIVLYNAAQTTGVEKFNEKNCRKFTAHSVGGRQYKHQTRCAMWNHCIAQNWFGVERYRPYWGTGDFFKKRFESEVLPNQTPFKKILSTGELMELYNVSQVTKSKEIVAHCILMKNKKEEKKRSKGKVGRGH